MKAFLGYGLVSLAVIAAIAAISMSFTSTAGRQGILAAAVLALGIQLIAFTVARTLQARHLLLGWGLGSLLRLAALVVFAVVAAKLWTVPLTPTLLSFAAFLFVTTVFEPLFLKR